MVPVAKDTAINPQHWNSESVGQQRNETDRKTLDPDSVDEIPEGAEKERSPIPGLDEATFVGRKFRLAPASSGRRLVQREDHTAHVAFMLAGGRQHSGGRTQVCRAGRDPSAPPP